MSIETFTPAEIEAAERVMRNALRTDFCAFVEKTFQTVCPGQTFWPNWHLKAICYALERVAAGETKRLIILVPPRSLKSICASVALPPGSLAPILQKGSSASAIRPTSPPSTRAIAVR